MPDVPAILKHMTLAIYRGPALKHKEGQITKGHVAKFNTALNIAVGQLVKYGYLTNGSLTGKPDDIRLTPKGMKREMHHKREGVAGPVKNMAFDMLYAVLHPKPKPEETTKEGVKTVDHGVSFVKKGKTTATQQQGKHSIYTSKKPVKPKDQF